MRRLIARRTLARVNKIRGQINLEPLDMLPVGERTEVRHCVIANAVPSGYVDGSGIMVQGRLFKHTLSSMFFIRMFDAGLYPMFKDTSMASDGKRRRMCETRAQTIRRKLAERKDTAAASLVGELRVSEEERTKLLQKCEVAEGRENDLKHDLTIEREISGRLEERMAEQGRQYKQHLSELIHEVPAIEPTEAEESEVEKVEEPVG